MTFTGILIIVVVFCFMLAWVLPVEAGEGTEEPIWQIFEEGAAKSVKWIDADNPRFAVYDNYTPADESDDVVLDKETGLVWIKTPSTTLVNWYDATYECIGTNAGGRMGWRLPAVEELQILMDGTSLPEGHPFSLIDEAETQPSYWSSTTDINNSDVAYPVCFPPVGYGCLYEAVKANPYNYVWCVRGGYEHYGE